MVHAQLLADPPVRPPRRLPQLVGDDHSLAGLVELPPCQIQGSGQRPLLLVGEPVLDDLGAVVAEYIGDPLAVVAVDDPPERAVAIDEDRDQDAVEGDVAP